MRAERRPFHDPGRRCLRGAVALAGLLLLAAGCHDGPRQAMYDQAKYEVYEASPLFDDDAAMRPFPEGTVARGHFDPDRAWSTGASEAGAYVTAFPQRLTVDRAFLRRGEQRYGVFCAPCHGALGYGDGMIVRRGYYQPASYHEARLQEMPHGYFFDVITNGFGRMPAYAPQIPVEDRWAIVAYLRALQLSQNARLASLPGEIGEVARRAMEAGGEDGMGEPAADLEPIGTPQATEAPADDAALTTASHDEDGE